MKLMRTFKSTSRSKLIRQISEDSVISGCYTPTKNIYEMKASIQVDKCLVTCTVYEIDMDWSWYYFGCDACQKRVIKTGTKNKIVNGIEITTHIWWCEACNDYVLKVSPRYDLKK
ncbi:unnamed protein product [Brassica rapa]|uniref:Replication factor A C-terminal domain-containing protein n=1 Tax=Brassica campestris TaxID=3711 RepID=A0A8D9HUT5_BRACM|nr:unnamed protein product [Brassica rapa]